MNMTVDASVGTFAVPSPAPFRYLGHEAGALDPTPTWFSKHEIVGCEASVRTVLRSTRSRQGDA
jgi:hypothetical protein